MKSKKRKPPKSEPPKSGLLFELPAVTDVEPQVGHIDRAIWTSHKARLIEQYLRLFVYVTRHGTYIDGFAGPQSEDEPGAWAAKLVLESRPWRLRHFYFFEKDKSGAERLRALKAAQPPPGPKDPERTIEILEGDFNKRVHEILRLDIIKESEATFCLLDQRTFECAWSTVEAIARHKKKGMKIELFYFLANWWMERGLAGSTTAAGKQKIRDWWGRDDWTALKDMDRFERVAAFEKRLKELGYRSVKRWPIYDEVEGQRVMYYMIHATDHTKAPGLMRRAYTAAVRPLKKLQLALPGFGTPSDAD